MTDCFPVLRFFPLGQIKRSPLAIALVAAGLNWGNSVALAQIPEPFPLFNQGTATYTTSGNDTPLNITSNQLNIVVDPAKAFTAGLEVSLSEAIEWDADGQFSPGDFVTFVFDVVNNSSIANPIRIPQQVRTLNIDNLGQNTITTANNSNQIVIHYDLNGDGKIAYTDANGNGRWDPFGTSGFSLGTMPEIGGEVWVWADPPTINDGLNIPDYFNPNADPTITPDAKRWSTGTVYLPPGVSFQVLITGQIPPETEISDQVGLILGNTGRDFGSSPEPSGDETYVQTAPDDPNIPQDVYTVNRPLPSDDDENDDSENDPSFDAQVESDSGLTFAEVTEPGPVDPFGRVVACNGQPLTDYTGYRAALYEATGPLQTELGNLLQLPQITDPDLLSLGLGVVNVNADNDNPFDIGLTEQLAIDLVSPKLRGQFNFFLSNEQVRVGAVYILVITPPPGTSVDERRVQIRITGVSANSFSYIANALDGGSLSLSDPNMMSQSLFIEKAEESSVFFFNTSTVSACQTLGITIQKTADRATVEPGGFAVYRLTVTNRSTAFLNNVEVRDRLPVGFQLRADSVRGIIGETPAPIQTQVNGQDITFTFQDPLPGGEPPENNPLARIVYAAEVTPDALRGDGRNVAFVEGDRQDNDFPVRDGPAVYTLGIRNGLLSDLGTIVGRVFEDKNFDGEQQYGEPGIPDAVVFMENGNRIVTDENGLFSVANVLPGWHTGVLDLTSVPGYAPAPNTTFIAEDRTYSRAVRLEPGAMVRMNFAVTPLTPGEER
ncbi:MAG: hypothetical protein VKJ86_10630 [Synechococcus sp.]|nr:hypothetical protein [Synechococcus sp.]